MMGKVKFGFVNDYGVFLHDTPTRLCSTRRTLPQPGCIRLERARPLASWLLGSDAAPPSGEPEQLVRLKTGVPYISRT